MGATYSSNDDLHGVIRSAVVSSRQMLLWSKPEEMAKVVNSILEEMDTRRTGAITRPAFFKAAALLDLETSIELLEEVFRRLDPEENGFIERSLLQRLATTRRQSLGTGSTATTPAAGASANRVRKLSLPGAQGLEAADLQQLTGGGLGAKADDEEGWREVLADLEAHLKGRPLRQTINEHPFARWQERSDAWEAKLDHAQERRLRLYRGVYPPLACKPEHARPASLRAAPKREGGGSSSGRRLINLQSQPLKTGRGLRSLQKRSPQNRRTQYLESVAKETTLEELQSITQFSGTDLQKLRERFYEEANASALSVEKFCAFFTREYPQLEGHQALLLRLFALFDTDSNGTVDFRELIMGMVKTVDSGVDDKMSLLFACIDLSADGNINLQELTHVIAKNQGDLKASIEYSRDFFSYLDTDQSGRVTLDEFKSTLKASPQLYKSLLRALPLPTTAIDVMEELQSSQRRADVAFSLENLKQLYKEYSTLHKRAKQGGKPRAMTRKAFRRVMGKHFGLTRLDQQKLLDRLFDAFDTDRSSSVSLEEILRGISLLIATKTKNAGDGADDGCEEACLDFYLDLIDGQSASVTSPDARALGSDTRAGVLGAAGPTLNENLRTVLQRSESKLRAEFEQSKILIEELSKTSESISGKDLIKLSQQHPELLNVLRQNLMR